MALGLTVVTPGTLGRGHRRRGGTGGGRAVERRRVAHARVAGDPAAVGDRGAEGPGGRRLGGARHLVVAVDVRVGDRRDRRDRRPARGHAAHGAAVHARRTRPARRPRSVPAGRGDRERVGCGAVDRGGRRLARDLGAAGADRPRAGRRGRVGVGWRRRWRAPGRCGRSRSARSRSAARCTATNPPPSRSHANVLGSEAEKVKWPSVLVVVPDGPESMNVSGGVVSGRCRPSTCVSPGACR